jgi:hypothetical protein
LALKADKGSAGVDGRTVQDTGEYLRQAWPEIRQRLLDGTYKPEPMRRVGLPKPGGGTRELGIPIVVDRLIQQALLQVLQPLIRPPGAIPLKPLIRQGISAELRRRIRKTPDRKVSPATAGPFPARGAPGPARGS